MDLSLSLGFKFLLLNHKSLNDMRKNYFRYNIALIRDVWRLTREEFGALFGYTGYHIGGHERGTSSVVPPSILFDLEDLTGIPARQLFYNSITRIQVPVYPLQKPDAAEQTTIVATEGTPQYNTQNMTQLERIERLEQKVFGV
jgi:hypothetical protein